jgi:hypothetical protein
LVFSIGFLPRIQHINVKQELQGGDRRLPLGLCLFALGKPQLENEKKKHVIHMKPEEILFPKSEP